MEETYDALSKVGAVGGIMEETYDSSKVGAVKETQS